MSDPCLKLVNELPVSERNHHYWKIKLCEKDLKMIKRHYEIVQNSYSGHIKELLIKLYTIYHIHSARSTL